MSNKPFIQNNWYGGETNDKYIASGQGQVQEASCINISNSKYFKSANSYLPYANNEYNISGIRQLITSNYTNRLIFFEGGKIYNLSGLVVDITKNIVNAGVYGSTGFIICSDGSIDTWTYDANVIDLGMSTRVANKLTGLTVNYYFAPFYIGAGNLYLATGSNVYQISTTSWTLTNTTTVLTGGQIRGITKIGDQYNIYVNYGASSKQYFWDGISTLPSYEINWFDRAILNVANMNNIDYVVCQDGLYRATGQQPEKLYDRTFYSEYTNAIETYQNKIYIPGYKCVYSYQSLKSGFPYQLTKEVVTPTFEGQGVTCMLSLPQTWDDPSGKYVNDLWIAYTNYYIKNSYYSYLIQYASGRELSSRSPMGGFVKINPIPDLYSNLKSNKKFRLGYYLPTTADYSRPYEYNGVSNTFYFKTSILVCQNTLNNKLTMYIGNVTTKPTVGAVYSINGVASTVSNVDYLFEGNSKWHGWIEFDLNPLVTHTYIEKVIGKITKTSGTGDATIYHLTSHYGELKAVYTDNTMNGRSKMITGNFNETEFILHITEGDLQANSLYKNERLLPKIYDFGFIYDTIQQDLI